MGDSNNSLEESMQNLQETQENLFRASAMLEAAFSNMTTVRSQVANQSASLASSTNSDMGPAHDAILLSGMDPSQPPSRPFAPSETSLSIRELRLPPEAIPPPMPSSLSEIRLNLQAETENLTQRAAELEELRQQLLETTLLLTSQFQYPGSALPPTSQSPRFGPRPDPTQPQTRRAALEHSLRSRRSAASSDSASTSLGRRVAARASRSALNPTRRASDAPLTSDTAARIMEIANNIQRDLTRISEQSDMLMARLSSRRASNATVTAGQSSRSSQIGGGTNASRAEDPSERRRHGPSQIWGVGRTSGTRRSETTSSRRARSSDSRVPQPPPMARQRVESPLLNSRRGVPIQTRTQNTGGSVTIEGRSNYRVRRRLNADGDEQLVNITMDSDDDDPFSWMLRRELSYGARAPARTRETTTQDDSDDGMPMYLLGRPRTASIRPQTISSSESSNNATRRRRGWARLDQDGNEIPTDEEAEYERSIAQMRARAQALSSGQAPQRSERSTATVPLPPPPQRRLVFVPTTQTSLWNTLDDDAESIRVRLNAARSMESVSEVLRDYLRSESPEKRSAHITFGSSIPFTPSPLPLPLVEKTSVLQVRSRVFRMSIRAPSQTPLAGR